MAVNYTDFEKIWASTSPLTPYSFSDANYKRGWDFVGSTPPSRQMWDFIQKQNDEKLKYIVDNFLSLDGGTMTGVIVLADGGNPLSTVGGTITGAIVGNPLTLTASDGNDSVDLVLASSGSATWNGKEVERVSAKSLGTNGYIRYESGLQMVWGEDEISSAKTYTFTVPFSANPVILGGTNSIANVSVTGVSATGFTGNLSSYPHGFRYIAIGKWK